MQKSEQPTNVKSIFPKDVILRIADYASASTLSNLYTAFFCPSKMNYQDRMLRVVKNFCDAYEARKSINTDDLKRFLQIDNEIVNDLCCLFDFLKDLLLASKADFTKQYYLSGRGAIPPQLYLLINQFNMITEGLLRFLWLRILFYDNNFINMKNDKFSDTVLYKDNSFLADQKSRLSTRHLNCTSHNLFIQYVSVILKYAKYFGFTTLIDDDEFHIKLKCDDFHYPEKLASAFNLNRYTLVNNRHKSIEDIWHYTSDIFFGLTVDNKKFSGEYCATQQFLEDRTCADAVDSINDDQNIGDFFDELSNHTYYRNTNTCAGNILCSSDYGEYLLDIKSTDYKAKNNYCEFCDTYFREMNSLNEPMLDSVTNKEEDSGTLQNMDCK